MHISFPAFSVHEPQTFFGKTVGSHVGFFWENMNTFVLLRLDHPSVIPSSWCPLSQRPENPGQRGTNVRGMLAEAGHGAGVAAEREHELTIGNRPREWKRLVVLGGSDLFRKFFSSS